MFVAGEVGPGHGRDPVCGFGRGFEAEIACEQGGGLIEPVRVEQRLDPVGAKPHALSAVPAAKGLCRQVGAALQFVAPGRAAEAVVLGQGAVHGAEQPVGTRAHLVAPLLDRQRAGELLRRLGTETVAIEPPGDAGVIGQVAGLLVTQFTVQFPGQVQPGAVRLDRPLAVAMGDAGNAPPAGVVFRLAVTGGELPHLLRLEQVRQQGRLVRGGDTGRQAVGELAKMPVPLGGDPLQQATAFRKGEQGGRQLREPVQKEFRVDQAGSAFLQAVRVEVAVQAVQYEPGLVQGGAAVYPNGVDLDRQTGVGQEQTAQLRSHRAVFFPLAADRQDLAVRG